MGATDTNFIQAASSNINLTPTRKVVQLQSQIEEIKKPDTWAKAVQGLKSVPEFSEKNCDKSDYEKENLEALINRNNDTVENSDHEKYKETADNSKQSVESDKHSADNGKQSADNGKQTDDDVKIKLINENKDNYSDNGTVWILPTEENKK